MSKYTIHDKKPVPEYAHEEDSLEHPCLNNSKWRRHTKKSMSRRFRRVLKFKLKNGLL